MTARGTSTDAYVTCLDVATDPARGNFLWTRQLGGAWIDMHGRNLAVDGSGNVYAVGDFIGSYTVNDGPGVGVPVLASGSNDGYLEKLSGTGDLLGVWQMGGKGGKTKAVEIGADGSVYTAGEFGASGGPSTFDTGTAYTALTGTGTFVSKMTQEGLATVVGRVLVDKGTIGVQDAADVLGMAPHTVTLTYNDGVARTSTVTTGPGGLYRFGHLPAVAYTITQTAPAGWTQSYGPAAGTLAAGAFAIGRDFGNTSPTATRTYANTTAVKIKPSGQYTNSTITIANTSTVYDINVKLDITYPNVSGLSVRLIAPNGTRFHLVSTGITGGGNYKGTIFDDQAAGRLPASSSTGYAGSYRPAFALAALNGQPLNGKWTLQVFNTLSGTSGTINSWSLEVTGRTLGSPLMVAGGQTAAPIESAVSLTEEQLRPIVRAAVARWEATGLTAAQRNELEHVDVRIADLAPGYLGMTGDNTIWIDTDAAGWGWFVDATPWDDSEFATPGNQGEQNRVDLLSALMHEMGHKLGSDHHADGLMAESLAAGTRLVPDSPTPAPDSMGHRSGMAERGLPHETRIAPESVPAGSPFNGVGREGATAGYYIATLLGVRVDPTPIDSTATISVEHLGNPQGPSDGTTAMRLGRHTVSGRFKVESLSISPAGVVTGTFSGVNAFVAATGDRLAMTTAPVVADGQSVRTVVFDAIFTVDSSARTGRLADATSSFRMIASAESISLASGFIPPFRRSWVGDGEHVLRKGKK